MRTEVVSLKLDKAYLCADLDCRTISNLHICPHCSSVTFSLARVLHERLSEGKAA